MRGVVHQPSLISDWLSSTIPPFFSTLAAARMRPTANSSGFGPNWRCRVYKKAHRAARKRPMNTKALFVGSRSICFRIFGRLLFSSTVKTKREPREPRPIRILLA